MSHSVFTSMYFGVNPARTVLSEQAMHSIQSRERAGERERERERDRHIGSVLFTYLKDALLNSSRK